VKKVLEQPPKFKKTKKIVDAPLYGEDSFDSDEYLFLLF